VTDDKLRKIEAKIKVIKKQNEELREKNVILKNKLKEIKKRGNNYVECTIKY